MNDEDCDYAIRHSELTQADLDALDLYQDLVRPVVRDLLGPQFVFDIRRLRLTYDDATMLLDALDVIHRSLPMTDAKSSVTGNEPGDES